MLRAASLVELERAPTGPARPIEGEAAFDDWLWEHKQSMGAIVLDAAEQAFTAWLKDHTEENRRRHRRTPAG